MGTIPVSLDMVCRPVKHGGLNLPTMNLALLSKWVAKIMSSTEELTLKVLRDCYGIC